MSPELVERKLAAILSADVVGYSRLMAEDEADTVRRLTAYRMEITNLAGEHRGRVVDFTGDNFLAEFPTATDAVEAAAEIQRVIKARNAALPEGRAMEFRIGVHLGEVRVEGARIYGDGVNIAARLEGLAEPGGVCISGTVLEQIRRKLELDFDDLGEQVVKNIPDPVHAYLLRERAAGAPAHARAPPDERIRRLRTALLVTAGIFLVVGTALWASWPRPLGLVLDLAGLSGPPVDPPLPDKPSIVVLPFANMSGDPEREYLSDGITEQITADISRNPELFVISRISAFTYKAKPVMVEDVGRELGVRYVLEGSVRQAGEHVRITTQLVEAATGQHVWSEQYDGGLADLFALQSEISEQIMTALGAEILWAETQRVRALPTENLSAYEAFLRAQSHSVRNTRADVAEARRLFQRAIELDPSFAAAHAGLGGTYNIEYGNGWNNLDLAAVDRAEQLAQRALELDPFSYNGHVILAYAHFYRERPMKAVAAAERSIELNPNSEFGHAALGLTLAQAGRIVPALQAINRALRLNPRASSNLLMTVAYVNLAAGRRGQAEELLERVRLSGPDNILVRVGLAALYEYGGRHEQARRAVQEALAVNPDLTAEIASRMIPGHEEIFPSKEGAQFEDTLRKAGLP